MQKKKKTAIGECQRLYMISILMFYFSASWGIRTGLLLLVSGREYKGRVESTGMFAYSLHKLVKHTYLVRRHEYRIHSWCFSIAFVLMRKHVWVRMISQQ
jgi:hypothetical protein